MGICVTAIVFAFFWQCVQPVNFWNEQAVIESMTFNSQSISPQCQEHFQDFKTRLKKPKQLYQRDSRWALKSKKILKSNKNRFAEWLKCQIDLVPPVLSGNYHGQTLSKLKC